MARWSASPCCVSGDVGQCFLQCAGLVQRQVVLACQGRVRPLVALGGLGVHSAVVGWGFSSHPPVPIRPPLLVLPICWAVVCWCAVQGTLPSFQSLVMSPLLSQCS